MTLAVDTALVQGPTNLTNNAGNQVQVLNGLTLAGGVTLRMENRSSRGSTGEDVGLNFDGGAQTLGGTGTVELFRGAVSPGDTLQPGDDDARVHPVAGSLTIGPGVTVRNAAGSGLTTLGNPSLPLLIQGTVSARSSSGLLRVNGSTVTNAGTIEGIVGVLDIAPTSFTNSGTVRASGGEVRVHPTTFSNLAGSTLAGSTYDATLTGGTWLVEGGSAIRMYVNASTVVRLTHLNADLRLVGAGSNVLGSATNGPLPTYDALDGLTAIDAEGALTLGSGRSLFVGGDFTSSGRLTIQPGAGLVPVYPLVSRYSAEGNADDDTKRNSGTVGGGITFGAGHTGQAFSFPASHPGVSVPDSPPLRTQRFSVSAWVNPSAHQNNAVVVAKTSNIAPPTDGFALAFSGTTGRLSFRMNAASNVITTPAALPLDAWTHVLASFDGTTMRLYLDGAEVASNASTSPLIPSGQPLTIGNSPASFPFRGLIDDVTYYNQALTPADAATLTPAGRAAYVQRAGLTRIDHTTFLDPRSTVILQGGTLGGVGTIDTDVTNTGGTVAPGSSPGILNITGTYVQGPGGRLLFELAGRDLDAPQFDRLRVTKSATLAGSVEVQLLDDFQPTPGDTFQVLTSSVLAGADAVSYRLPPPGGPGRRLAPLFDLANLAFQTQLVPPLDFVHATVADGPTAADSLTPLDVALDAAGNAYVIGRFQGTVDFDLQHTVPGDTLTADSAADGYLAQYDPSGQLLWVRRIDSSGVDPSQRSALALDDRGNADPTDDWIYATGPFSGDVSYDGGPPVTIGTAGSFLLKVDASGSPLALAGLAVDSTDLAVAPDGGIVLVGAFRATADLDPGAGVSNLVSAGSSDAFAAQYSPGLALVRAARLGGLGMDQANAVAVDPAGDVWFAGTFAGATVGGLASLTPLGDPAGITPEDVFLLKLRGSGTGFTTLVERAYGGPGSDFAEALAVDPDGNVIVGGAFPFSIDFDVAPDRAFTLTSNGDDDLFLLKLDSGGGFRWARVVGGYDEDRLRDLAIDSRGNIYATGFFRDRVDFDPLDGTYLLSTGGGESSYEAFLSKLDPDGPVSRLRARCAPRP